MVKLTPDRINLEPGYTSFPSIFRRMGLYPGDKFENRSGTTLVVVSNESTGKWLVVPAEDED